MGGKEYSTSSARRSAHPEPEHSQFNGLVRRTAKEEDREPVHKRPEAGLVRNESDVSLQHHLVVPEAVGPC